MLLMGNHQFVVREIDGRGHVVRTFKIPPASEKKVGAFEKLIGERLPEDYRRFLKTTNGVELDTDESAGEYACFAVKWGGDKFNWLPPEEKKGLGIMYNLKPEFIAKELKEDVIENVLSLSEKYKEFRNLEEVGYPFVPDDLIPIGDTPVESDQIVLGIKGDNRGKVLYYMLQEDPTKPYENVGFVANSFDEFLQSIHLCEEKEPDV